MIYLHILGRMPTAGQARVLDAALVTLVDHGVMAAGGARMVYRASPDAIQGAIEVVSGGEVLALEVPN